MIKLDDVITNKNFAIISVFDEGLIQKTKNEIDSFNQKTDEFKKEVEKIKKAFEAKITKILKEE